MIKMILFWFFVKLLDSLLILIDYRDLFVGYGLYFEKYCIKNVVFF